MQMGTTFPLPTIVTMLVSVCLAMNWISGEGVWVTMGHWLPWCMGLPWGMCYHGVCVKKGYVLPWSMGLPWCIGYHGYVLPWGYDTYYNVIGYIAI